MERPRGRAVDGSEVGPSRTATQLLSAEVKKDIGKEIGRRLRSIEMASRFVEFVVPGSLICADFDAIKIDVNGEMDSFGGEALSMEIPLGMWARVVVRPLDRWRPQFWRDREALLAQWKQRWGSMTSAMANHHTSWWWKSGLDHISALAVLGLPEHRNVGCVGLGFAPTGPEMVLRLYGVLLAVGAPVALWTREIIESDSEELLRDILDAPAPPDLRDRVQAQRARSGDQAIGSQLGRVITLFWDDPERPPLPLE